MEWNKINLVKFYVKKYREIKGLKCDGKKSRSIIAKKNIYIL